MANFPGPSYKVPAIWHVGPEAEEAIRKSDERKRLLIQKTVAASLLNHAETFRKLAQEEIDVELDSPNIIMPGEPTIQKAVQILQRMDPMYFKGVRRIDVVSSANYGHVESGPDKDPAVVNINLSRIAQESGGPTAGPEATMAAAIVIAHEVGHVRTFDAQQGFVGGEGPAEAEEGRVRQWIEQNMDSLQL